MHENIQKKLNWYLENETFCDLLDKHNVVDLFAGVDEFDIPWLIDILKEEGVQVPQTYLNMYDLSRSQYPVFSKVNILNQEELGFNLELHLTPDSLFIINLINLIYYKNHSGLFSNIDNLETFGDVLLLNDFNIEYASICIILDKPLDPTNITGYNLPKVRIVIDGLDTILSFEIYDRSFYDATSDFEFDETGYSYKVNINKFIQSLNEAFEFINSMSI